MWFHCGSTVVYVHWEGWKTTASKCLEMLGALRYTIGGCMNWILKIWMENPPGFFR
jgi:hypothetical protein